MYFLHKNGGYASHCYVVSLPEGKNRQKGIHGIWVQVLFLGDVPGFSHLFRVVSGDYGFNPVKPPKFGSMEFLEPPNSSIRPTSKKVSEVKPEEVTMTVASWIF